MSTVNYAFVKGKFTEQKIEYAIIDLFQQTMGDAPDAETMNAVVEEMVARAISYTGVESIVDTQKAEDFFSDEFAKELAQVKMPITKFKVLLKLVRKAIRAYDRTSKVKAQEFGERLRGVVESYNNRDRLQLTSEVASDFVDNLSDQIIAIMRDLEADKSSFAKMGITYEEKALYDILVKVREDHGFPYAEEKCVVLAREIEKLVNDKAQFADWSTREDIKSQLSMELTVLLYKNGYPPQWDEEVFEKVFRAGRKHEEERGISIAGKAFGDRHAT